MTLDQTPAKCILLVQCAALPWMVQAKLVSPVELYVTCSLTFFFGFLCHVHCTEAGGDCDEGGKRGSVFFNFKGEDDPNECKKKLCSWFIYLCTELCRVRCFLQVQFCVSTYFLLSYLAELYSSVAPCNLGRRISSPHNMACRDG